MNNNPILLTDRITRTMYKRVSQLARRNLLCNVKTVAKNIFSVSSALNVIGLVTYQSIHRSRSALSVGGGTVGRSSTPASDWSEHWLASWGLAGLILASLVVFGVLGCDRQAQPAPSFALTPQWVTDIRNAPCIKDSSVNTTADSCMGFDDLRSCWVRVPCRDAN